MAKTTAKWLEDTKTTEQINLKRQREWQPPEPVATRDPNQAPETVTNTAPAQPHQDSPAKKSKKSQ